MPPLLVAIAALLGVTVFRPPTSVAQLAPPTPPTPDAARATFQRDCAVCHGADATGTSRGPSLQGVGRAAVDYELTTGRMPLLPNFRTARSPENQPPLGQVLPAPSAASRQRPPAYPPALIAALEDYIASIAPGGPDIPQVDLAQADLATGGELYRLQCAACHEWAGVGGALYQREAPGLHGVTPTQVAEAMIVGPGQMPKFGPPAVPADQVSNVAGYVEYLGHPDNRGGNPLWYIGPVAEGAVTILVGLGAVVLVSRWIGDRS
ncbi:MAG TPA: c-type cytochrome [Acidimicrobiales bacterium]|nr:c-type cytochrome [Acidimicrobiales bacterium]